MTRPAPALPVSLAPRPTLTLVPVAESAKVGHSGCDCCVEVERKAVAWRPREYATREAWDVLMESGGE